MNNKYTRPGSSPKDFAAKNNDSSLMSAGLRALDYGIVTDRNLWGFKTDLGVYCESAPRSTGTVGRLAMFKNATTGELENATNTDTQVSAAVTASHARSHALDSTSDHSLGSLTSGYILKNDGSKLANSIILESSGNVGVAELNPVYKLHVGSGASGFRVDGNTVSGGVCASFGPYGDFDVDAASVTGGRFTVKNSGLVGVGINSPSTKFHVSGYSGTTNVVDDTAAEMNVLVWGSTGVRNHEFAIAGTNVPANDSTLFYSMSNPNSGFAFATRNGSGTAGIRAVITGAGNVGIGTTSPGSKLTVNLASEADIGLRVSDGTTASNICIQPLTGALSGFQAINFNGYHTGSAEARFNTSKNRWRMYVDQRSSTDKFFIDTYNGSAETQILTATTAGYVGIGVAAPGTALEVNGTINSKTASSVGVYQIGDTAVLSAASGTLLSINSGGFTNVNIGGNVGIGTNTPNDLFEIYKSVADTVKCIINNPNASGASRVEFRSNAGIAGFVEYNNSTSAFRISNYNAGSYGSIILNSSGGDVGIGTATPSGRLDVKSSATNTNIIVCRSSSDVSQLIVKQDASNNCTMSVHNASATIGWMLNSAGDSYFTGGNFGIGSNTPDTKLYIKEAGSSSTGTMVRLLDDNSGGYDYVFLDMQADTLAHGMTAIFPSTKTACFIKSESGTGGMGGIRIVGGSGNVTNAGVKIEAIHPGSTTDATMRLDFAKVSSTSRAAIDATYKGLAISNNGTERACMYGNGNVTLTFASTDTLTFREQTSGAAGVSLVEANTLLALRANSVTGINITSAGVSIFLHLHLGTLPKSDSGLLDGEAWIDTSAGNAIKLAGTV